MKTTIHSARMRQYAALLRRCRDDLDLKQQDIARLIGVSRSTVSDHENSRRPPGVARSLQMARAVGTTLTAMVESVEQASDVLVPVPASARDLEPRFVSASRSEIEQWCARVRLCVELILRAVRDERGLSEDEVAGRLGESQPFVSKYEGADSEPRNIDLFELAAVAIALGGTWVELAERIEREVPPIPLVCEDDVSNTPSSPNSDARQGDTEEATLG